MAGITNLKTIVAAGGQLAGTAMKVLADGKVNLSDAFTVLAALQSLKSVASVDVKAIPGEIKDLSQDEARELVDAIFRALKDIAA
jgi:tmRNA-binding protein